MSAALLLIPDFTLILIGLALMRWGRFETAFWLGLERIVYFVLFPALLFHSIVRTPFHFDDTAALAYTGLLSIAVGIALGWLARPFVNSALDWASSVQCAFRFNSYIALALAGRLGAESGIALMAVLIGIGVPLCNAAAVYALSRHSPHGLLKELARNPLLVATLSGLVCNAAGLVLPEFVAGTLSRLGAASIALGLIAVGAGLRLSGWAQAQGLISWLHVVKLICMPAVALGAGLWLGLRGQQLQIAVLFAAMPTASSAYILAQRMGGNGPLVAIVISSGTVLSALSIPVWIALASSLG